MALPYTLTPDFPRAVDNLIQDTALSDSSLHSRAARCLDVFHDSGLEAASHGSVHSGPPWAERIHKASPHFPPFTTPKLFSAMYEVADELGLVAGRRYVSAAICVCGEHAAPVDGDGAAGGARALNLDSEQADLVRAVLHQLSSLWAAFVLWPCEYSVLTLPCAPQAHILMSDHALSLSSLRSRTRRPCQRAVRRSARSFR